MRVLPLLLLLLWAAAARAQVPVPRPAEEPLPPALPGAEQPAPPIELPPIPEAREERLSGGLRVFVREFAFEGNRVLSDAELAVAVAPWAGREITSEELLAARDAVTQLYLERSYVTSGALVPDQPVSDGVVHMQIVEGVLADVIVEGTRRFRPEYFASRLRRHPERPVRVDELESELRLLQQNPQVERLAAQLRPGTQRGEAVLHLLVEEAEPWRVELEASNFESPSVGSTGGALDVEYGNVTGRADALRARIARTEGYEDLDLRYRVPLDARDTTLSVGYRQTQSKIVEHPFEDLDVKSESVSWSLGVALPVLRTPAQSVWLGLVGERRRSETFVLGERFSFGSGPERGQARVTVLRLYQQWQRSAPEWALAARSSFSFGIDAFDATRHDSSSIPDGRFVAWLGQMQWVWQLPDAFRGARVHWRADLQLASDPLLSLEQFALGGHRTVRGYAENELVRDNGWVTSAELRVPLLRDGLGRVTLELVPFVDVGRAWNEVDQSGIETLSSLGVGLVARPNERLELEAWWGGRLRDVKERGSGLQNDGFQLGARYRAF